MLFSRFVIDLVQISWSPLGYFRLAAVSIKSLILGRQKQNMVKCSVKITTGRS